MHAYIENVSFQDGFNDLFTMRDFNFELASVSTAYGSLNPFESADYIKKKDNGW
jgi:hypothetical protein